MTEKSTDNSPEYVVLVDEDNNEVGLALKSEVHTDDTPLHRAFSAFLFTHEGELLLQQRNLEKKTWPGIWSNSCCGHLSPGESAEDAVRRRVPHELGITLGEVWNVLPEYRYRVELDGVVENEICPVFVSFIEEHIQPNPDEVADTRWVPWTDFLAEVKQPNPPYSAWSIEEAQLLEKSAEFQQLYAKHTA